MNRAEFKWALDAVMPHAKGTSVGVEAWGTKLYVWATDLYSAGIAAVDYHYPPGFSCALSAKEAREVERFIRPESVADGKEPVELLVEFTGDQWELHVGVAQESAVFDCLDKPDYTLANVLIPTLRGIKDAPYQADDWTFNPDIFARFSRAKRLDTQRLTMHPRLMQDGRRLAIVTVGSDFIGAAAGMTDGEGPRLTTLLEGE